MESKEFFQLKTENELDLEWFFRKGDKSWGLLVYFYLPNVVDETRKE